MEEDEYRRIYRQANPHRCLFEKAILARRCDCSRAQRHNLAEREAMGCTSAEGHAQCEAWLQLVREKAQFALQLVEVGGALPHAKEIRVQAGGVQGLVDLLTHAGELVSKDDIDGLLTTARACYGTLEEVPFDAVVRAVGQFRARPRRRGKD